MKMKNRYALGFSAIFVLSFIAGGAAFPVTIFSIDPISSGEVDVSPAHAAIEDVDWVIDPTTSTVEGILVTVRSTYTDPFTDPNRVFTVVVQVSCLSSGAEGVDTGNKDAQGNPILFDFKPSPFICAAGSFDTTMLHPGEANRVPIDFEQAIPAEKWQIENLSVTIRENT